MANLGTFTIPADGEYHDLEELSELTFTASNTYTMQILNPAYIREGSDGTGFYMPDGRPFQWTAGADMLYVRADYQQASINIAG